MCYSFQFSSWKMQVKLFALFLNLGFVYGSNLLLKLSSLCVCVWVYYVVRKFEFCTFFISIPWGEVSGGDQKALEWKRLNSKELGISTSMITKPTRKVLNGLKRKGKNLAYSWF